MAKKYSVATVGTPFVAGVNGAKINAVRDETTTILACAKDGVTIYSGNHSTLAGHQAQELSVPPLATLTVTGSNGMAHLEWDD